MDVWKNQVQQDISELKNGQARVENEQTKMKDDIRNLQVSDKLQDQEISSVKSTLSEIREDTKWLRRAITNALIVALIGGAIAIFYAGIKNF